MIGANHRNSGEGGRRVPRYRVQVLGTSEGQSVTITCEEGEVITDAAEREGVILRVSCNNGGCGACRAKVLEGNVGYIGPVSKKKRIDPATGEVGYELLCRATPLSDLVVRPLNDWKCKGRHPWAQIHSTKIKEAE